MAVEKGSPFGIIPGRDKETVQVQVSSEEIVDTHVDSEIKVSIDAGRKENRFGIPAGRAHITPGAGSRLSLLDWKFQ